MRRGIN